MRTGIQQDAPDESPARTNERIAAIFVALAGLGSLFALAGWIFDVPAFRGFGLDGNPVWPLTAVGYLALVLSYPAAIRGSLGLARLFWCLALAIVAVSIVQTLGHLNLGVDRLMFGSIVDRYSAPHPGRPSAVPLTIFLFFSVIGLHSSRRVRPHTGVGRLIATVSLALGAAVGVALLLLRRSDPLSHYFWASPAATLIGFALVAAFIARHRAFGMVEMLSSQRAELQILRVLLPIALIFPLLPSLLELAFVRGGMLTPALGQSLVALSNVLIVAAFIYWAITRVTRQQAALFEIREALDVATVATTTLDGQIVHWSHGCEQLYGWSASEARGHNKYALLRSRCEDRTRSGPPRDSGANVQSLVEQHRSGKEVAVLESAQLVAPPGGAPIIVLSITDVSETAGAMAALRASEELLAVAAAVHQLGVFEWDVPSGRIEWSPGTEQRLGVTPGSLADFDSWRAMIEPGDMENILDTLARTVADHAEEFSFRCRFLELNGGVRAVEGTARAFYDEVGNLIRAIGTMIDVTEREERETALRRREAQLRSILRTVPDAMVVIDQEGEIRQFSAAAEALWGHRAVDVVGCNIAMLAPEGDRIRYTGAIEKFLETGNGRFLTRVVNGTGETADGRQFPVEFHTGQAQADGETLFTIFFRDLSEKRAAEERLSELSGELAHVSRQSAMSELAADIAHELNQPLSATANFLSAARMLIERGEEAARVSDLLRMGTEQTQRAGQIIRRMRDFTSRREVDMRPESVEQTVQDAAELVLVGTGQFHIRLSYDFDPLAQQIFADRIQVQQVLVNLLRNAMQALRELPQAKREIIIASRKIDGQMIEISVCDSGPGIPEAILTQLFTRFVTTKNSGAGVGIGLSISKRIIEAHGGMLSAENHPQGGACFRFTLPAVEEDEEE